MCQGIKLISKVKSGELTFCETCKIYHLEFNNLFFELSTTSLKKLETFLLEIDIDYWEKNDVHFGCRRKIPVISLNQNLVLMFNRYEIEELKTLVLKQKPNTILNVDAIDYQFILN